MTILLWIVYGIISGVVITYFFPHPLLGDFTFLFCLAIFTLLGGMDIINGVIRGKERFW